MDLEVLPELANQVEIKDKIGLNNTKNITMKVNLEIRSLKSHGLNNKYTKMNSKII